MFGLLTWKFWAIAFAVVLAGTNAITALKVYDHVRTKYETLNLKNKIKYVEREVKVAVLDGKTLQAALTEQKQRLENKAEFQRKIDEQNHKRQLEEAAGVPWCELDADELRIWNDENRRAFNPDNPGESIGRVSELRDPHTKQERKDVGSLD